MNLRLLIVFFLCSYQSIFSTTYTVTTTADSGAGSLRQAIIDANANPSPHTINFSIATGVQTIVLSTALPAITNSNITIDATTQTGYASNDPQIVIDGSSLTAYTFDGLSIQSASGCTINGLVVNNGFNSGISILGTSNNNTIQNCFSGVNQAGTTAVANKFGIFVQAGTGTSNTGTLIENNLCSGNDAVIAMTPETSVGIVISKNISNFTVRNNKVGTDKTGMSAIPNGAVGLALIGEIPSSGSMMSATADLTSLINTGLIEDNLISGHDLYPMAVSPGLFMGFQNVTNITIQGNKIGTDITGTAAIPNHLGLITFTDAATTIENCLIQNNLISANFHGPFNFGANIQLLLANNNTIRNNKIGTEFTGLTVLGTNGTGISIIGNNNTIGGILASDGNLIAGTTNFGNGIELQSNSSNNTISNNYIGCNINGVSASATLAIDNTGIQISGYDSNTQTIMNSDNNIITNNLISRTTNGSGIYISPGCNSTTIDGNTIGTDAGGTTARSIGNNGIQVEGNDFNNHIVANSNNTVITNNLVSNCTQTGILINSGSNNSIIQGNKIGTDTTGTVSMGNGNCGIQIQGNDGSILVASDNTQIGGTSASERNIISGNTNQGININLGVSNTIIQGNYIGVDSTGMTALANGQQGISINGFNGTDSLPCNNTQIGGTVSGARNIISGNLSSGIQLNNDVHDTVIQGNYIGVGSDGITTILNGFVGILLAGSSTTTVTGTIIGGTTSSARNIISGNTNNGIYLQNNVHDSIIQGNYIGFGSDGTTPIGNGLYGIQIQGSGAQASTNNLIGGTTTAAQNIIANNTSFGVLVQDDSILNPILGNEIYSNGGNGISLAGNGNNLQAGPTLDSAEHCTDDDIVIITVTAPTTPISSNFRIEFFGNTTDTNPITEGQFFIGAISSLASGASTTVSFPTSDVGASNYISATATNLNNTGGTPGDTSEFSINILIVTATPPTAFLEADPTAICFGTFSDLTLTMTGSSPFSVNWSDGVEQTNVTSPLLRSVNPSQTTIYSALVRSVYGCSTSSNSVNITVYPLANIAMQSSAAIVYPGQMVTITVNITGNGPFDLTWFDGVTQTGVVSSASRTFTINEAMDISVSVIDANGCESSSSIFIFIGKMSLIAQAILNKYGC